MASLADSSYIHLVIIALLVVIIYSSTLGVPFQWDEADFLVKNPFIRDIHYFTSPSDAEGLKTPYGFVYSFLVLRYVGFLTFALNYGIHGFSVAGYHIVNIALHIANSVLLYVLVLFTFRTPSFAEGSSAKRSSRSIALFSSVLFAVHPLQTMAVTYIFQRFVPLATCFFLLSLTTYIASRLSAHRLQKLSLYAVSFVSAVLAMKTKEIAFTLPVVITLYEFLFFKDTLKRRALFIVPLLLTMTIIPLTILYLTHAANRGTDPLPGYLSPVYSRGEYLLTEFRVIITYVRLLFMPVHQNIDYDYPVSKSFFDPRAFFSFVFLAALFFLGAYLAKGKRAKTEGAPPSPEGRLVGFGILWFFITLSVESSIVPLTRLIDEYRVYLPSVGVSIAMVTAVFMASGRIRSPKARKIVPASILLVAGALAVAAYQRNEVWGDDVRLWNDTAKKSPMKDTVHNNLGWAYQSHGMFEKAIEEYLIAIRLKPDHAETHNNLGFVYQTLGMVDKAMAEYLITINLKPNLAEPHNNLGFAYQTMGRVDKAMEQYLIAAKLNPHIAEPHFSLGSLYYQMGQLEKARKETVAALEINPDYQPAQQLLNRIMGNR